MVGKEKEGGIKVKKQEAPSCWNCRWANWIRVYLWFCTWSMRLRMTPQYKCKKHDWMDSYEHRKDKETIEG